MPLTPHSCFINIVIFGLGLALALVGRVNDAATSVMVIIINIMIGLFQEIRAKRTLDAIALLNQATATVIRDGRERPLAPDELVLGDLIKAGPGDQIVLDGRLRAGRMQVDESQLTGESQLIGK